ncbi:MAG: DUF1730 domain-containing protein [Ruminococcaceae bacterium]|nr:DUF1730 domain-containing protein [Oscillospiraceae bacterium]
MFVTEKLYVEAAKKKYILDVIRKFGADDVGVCTIEKIGRIPCRAERLIPEEARSLVVAVFGYYSGDYPERNVAKYAIPDDYHEIVRNRLEAAVETLKEAFPEEKFAVFCDVSPFCETQAAQQAGLGVIGKNGLLINPKVGLYHFIGEIATTLSIEPDEGKEESCIGCGKCLNACPTGAVKKKDKSICLSAITQRKGELTAEEQRLIAESGMVWGCDLCMDICPMNHKKLTEIAEFRRNLEPVVTPEKVSGLLKQKAWGYRGRAVMERNLAVVNGKNTGNDPHDL